MTQSEGPPRSSDTEMTSGRSRRPEPLGPDIESERPDEEEGRIGIFRSWRTLYVAVVLYTAALIALLYVFTRLLDFSS